MKKVLVLVLSSFAIVACDDNKETSSKVQSQKISSNKLMKAPPKAPQNLEKPAKNEAPEMTITAEPAGQNPAPALVTQAPASVDSRAANSQNIAPELAVTAVETVEEKKVEAVTQFEVLPFELPQAVSAYLETPIYRMDSYEFDSKTGVAKIHNPRFRVYDQVVPFALDRDPASETALPNVVPSEENRNQLKNLCYFFGFNQAESYESRSSVSGEVFATISKRSKDFAKPFLTGIVDANSKDYDAVKSITCYDPVKALLPLGEFYNPKDGSYLALNFQSPKFTLVEDRSRDEELKTGPIKEIRVDIRSPEFLTALERSIANSSRAQKAFISDDRFVTFVEPTFVAPNGVFMSFAVRPPASSYKAQADRICHYLGYESSKGIFPMFAKAFEAYPLPGPGARSFAGLEEKGRTLYKKTDFEVAGEPIEVPSETQDGFVMRNTRHLRVHAVSCSMNAKTAQK